MNKFHFLSLFCLIAGIIFFGFGFLSGDVETGIFVIFPFLAGSGIYAFLGFIFIFIAFFFFMFGFTTYSEYDEFQPRKKTSVKGGGIILIGPIPIVIGSNWKIAIVLMIVAIIMILVAFYSFRYL